MASGSARGSQTRYYFNGVELYSPYKLYPSQKMMITKTIGSIESCQHCLLESPTGSGKTLALLCAALAWQEKEYDLLYKEMEMAASAAQKNNKSHIKQRGSVSQDGLRVDITQPQSPQSTISTAATSPGGVEHSGFTSLSSPLGSLDGDEDFKPVKRMRVSSSSSVPSKDHALKAIISAAEPFSSTAKTEVSTNANVTPDAPSVGEVEMKRRKVPKIYYGTRTHKQITQIVRELGKTAYKDVRMTIIGSRDNTCIHPEVSVSSNKNDFCRELITKHGSSEEDASPLNQTCRYYHGSSRLKNQSGHSSCGVGSPWDLEDLKAAGKQRRFCPYFTARDLMDTSDIIFCPYQYLIDPMIRKSMGIGLANQILIIDEAHNIEDVSREAASFSITEEELLFFKSDLERHAKLYQFDYQIERAHNKLATMCSRLLQWLHSKTKTIYEDDGQVLNGVDMVAYLTDLEMGPSHFENLKTYLDILIKEEADTESKVLDKVSTKTVKGIEGMFLALDFLFGRDLKNVEDFKICLKKVPGSSLKKEDIGGPSISRRRTVSVNLVTSLNFWCFNPALAFYGIGNCVRSVILASGTLAPTDSFESELGLKFPVKLEAPHVISPSQIWVGTIGKGPNNSKLICTYQNTSAFTFQDEIGQAVLKICKTVPHGVLCFFPSYSLLDKLSERWQCTGLWTSIEQCKRVVCEPRRNIGDNFKHCMAEFFEGVENSGDSPDSNGCTGSLLLAVCRGKVSEGIDFADNYARAVITIGIPFPNFKDPQIKLKREYNDIFSKLRGLISGSRWYEIQAYRALNQALGRCVRHSEDWGAILLIDERFTTDMRHTNNLSKWVRQYIRRPNDFDTAIKSLQDFVHERKTQPISSCPPVSATHLPQFNIDSPIRISDVKLGSRNCLSNELLQETVTNLDVSNMETKSSLDNTDPVCNTLPTPPLFEDHLPSRDGDYASLAISRPEKTYSRFQSQRWESSQSKNRIIPKGVVYLDED